MNKLYKTLLCIVFALSLSAVQSHDLEKAISSSDRLATNITRDMSRHPHETLTFFGIESNMTVVELSPGGGWYTEILANYIHYPGTLIAAHFNPELGDYYAKSRKKFNNKIITMMGVKYLPSTSNTFPLLTANKNTNVK